jgi:8-oxo-dGTP pyrophosphatase MutT (NUDIX family)
VLLVHRARDGANDWVLPGGTPRPGESMFSRVMVPKVSEDEVLLLWRALMAFRSGRRPR